MRQISYNYLMGKADKKHQLELRRMEVDIMRLESDLVRGELEKERIEIELEKARFEQSEQQASASANRILTFAGSVESDKVTEAMETLEAWSRRDPGQPMTVVFNSPGGSVTDGLALFDTILDLRSKGHAMTTVARGQVASMGGVLLQAGSERVIGPGAHMLIHQVAWSGHGKMGNHEDQLQFSRMLEKKALQILASRSSLSQNELSERWKRRDWWLSAKQVVKLGFADRIG